MEDYLFFIIAYVGVLWIGWRSHAAYIRSRRHDISNKGTHRVNRILRHL